MVASSVITYAKSYTQAAQNAARLQVGGFVPSFGSGTFKTRATTQPPVSSQALWLVAKRWGVQDTRWALELLFDDLFVQVL